MTTPTYTITIGLESPTLTVSECRAFALVAAADCFPSGHTVTEATGRWLSPDRGVIDEPSLVITVITDDRDAVGRFCSVYKAGAFQDAVLLQVSRPETIWV